MRVHKRREDIESYHDSCDHYEHSYGSKNMYNEHNDSYNYGAYSCGRSSQTLRTTSRPLSYNNLKLPFLWGTFGPYDYEAWEQEVELLFYFYGIREEEKFQLVLKSLSYESLMKQAFRNRCGVDNHEGLGRGQPKVKFMESSMVEELQR
ncbi:hypothetical protein M9H77_21629 [Catharanthus roseus]|uniref:Uncharacterized protein n=1 Tax=Catharanthus roseus TaxID=4058 RepID=A0ACC0ANL0_CATRO|nr:hypothetical protein M9H77_21629 [Catharanthus roseus]